MSGRADKNHSTFGIVKIVATPWNRTTDVMLIAQILIGQIVLGTNQYTGWSIFAPRYGYQEVGMLL